ncbi:MAG TPA: alcohol dehydrogenase catalytic domain-containing protein [Candidatus Aminicenantes bacterium]|nr:alcohol dehydrogenase catalytic domain-containing protein [Candidatus Aminicenantes bacterium]HRY63876.1 alcohol dehydrogenase catalytic domain-containing protein [Candidatus Aminicenantes bacterium]HRZ70789.1 alcohol dehydrogenase catalytic domain-containing protein [Candidatus Aminicenantes bacterium]
MKAAFLTGVRTIEIRDIPAPRLVRDDDVIVRSRAVGVCGSDLHYYLSDNVGGDRIKYPFIPGHECAGVVEEVGRAVTRVKPGDPVVVEPAVSCGTCDQCRTGRPHTCRKLLFLGHYGELTGGLAELILAPERNCVPLPARMTSVQGALAEPLSIALYAAGLAGSVRGKAAAVLGTGPIGLCVVMALKADGAGAVYATEKVEARRAAAAAKAGADWTGNPDAQDVVAEIAARESLGLDIVFECCGQQPALDQAVALLKPGGTLVVVGIPLEPRVYFDSGRVRRREIRVQNVRRQNKCLERAVAMIHAGRIPVDFLATHTFPLDRAGEAYEIAAARHDGVIKAIVRP